MYELFKHDLSYEAWINETKYVRLWAYTSTCEDICLGYYKHGNQVNFMV